MRYLLPCVLLLTLPCAFAGADDSAIELWDRLYVGGAHSGHVHTVAKTVGEADAQRIVTSVTTDLKLVRLGSTTLIYSKSETWESPDGTLLRIVSEMKQSGQLLKSTYTFSDGKLTQETLVMGNTRKVESEVAMDLVGPAFSSRALKDLVGTKGKEVRLKSYMPDFQQVMVSVSTSGGVETTTLHDGTEVQLTRIESVIEGVPGMRPISWINEQGDTIKTDNVA